jgi:uncharacterized protein GlcG (DUF336 family)
MMTMEKAQKIIEAGIVKAKQIGQPMNIAVVDAGANLTAFARMDGAWLGSIDIAINKAFTAKAFDISTQELGRNSQPKDQFFGIAFGVAAAIGAVICLAAAASAAMLIAPAGKPGHR